ncbi:TPA: YhgE/Pip domain-containing protein [Streptococcus equi subsp. zooepidemicus]|uniref:YhgE/Pip domain-containing protein n=1 Tax=Streptococcus equi TaxID=1336 RepID=UPI001E455528|nr:YhgE/Pip domain-containing protein [Streptococcus equi]MCD3441184.1 YhgE/Pip domain-containing protein [Streptococcus equi subsp. zooepidemicus]HEK9073821.1 YhgE/Pip domain-containing protein [Streptococcus equi subsp. zooepidemicus]HEL0000262.1 YhgE/Pip domain-containing protein [Streptococcus equi subsp. zooepidemicus]HEL0595996.1 YhgE/Pip domain-containing protein [Streptococcus equi subsp. zooepidemicus]HEL0702872.1 YhgE/Pip domain-containing protein [Streptococcus equi subsp. zooepidem
MLEGLKAIIKNRKVIVTMIGVALVPALYNLSFLGSMWDPYGRVDQLPVAVVNQDKPAYLNNKRLTIGKDMVDNMSKNKELDYHFVAAGAAQRGLEKGRYYMTITLPKDLSQKATTLLDQQPEKLIVSYQTSKGHSFIASKMGESAMNHLRETVSKNIRKTYITSVFKSMHQLQSGLKEASDGGQQLAAGLVTARTSSQLMSRHLNTLSESSARLSQGADNLSSGIAAYTAGVGQLDTGLGQLATDMPAYLDGVSRLSKGANQLNAGLTQLALGSDLSQDKQANIQALMASLPKLNQAIQQLNTNLSLSLAPNVDSGGIAKHLADMTRLVQELIADDTADKNNQLAALQATATYQGLSSEQQEELSTAISKATTSAKTMLTSLQALSEELEAMSTSVGAADQLRDFKALVNQLSYQADQILPGTGKALSELSTGLRAVHSATTAQLLSGSQALAGGFNQLTAKNEALTAGLSTLATGATALNHQSSQLLAGGQQLTAGANQLAFGANELSSGSSQLTDGLTTLSTGLSSLTTSLSKASDQLSIAWVEDQNADMVSDPVALSEKDKDKVRTNGIGMAPYMIAVSLMVVALSTNIIFAEALSGKPIKDRWDWAKQKLLINGMISTVGSVILYTALQLLGFEANDGIKTLGFIMLSGWTLMALVTALVGWDARYGAFASLIMLLLQVGAAGGSYPIELSGQIFQILHPYLPMSYIVSGLRQTISLTAHIGLETGVLVGFLLSFMAIGVLIYRPKDKQSS